MEDLIFAGNFDKKEWLPSLTIYDLILETPKLIVFFRKFN